MKFSLAFAAAVAALFPNIAAAKSVGTPRGYHSRVMPSGRVCLQPRTDAESTRLGIPVGFARCRMPARWAAEGLRVEIRGTQPA